MTVISNPLLLKKKAAAGGGAAYQIERSIRFNGADEAYFKRDLSSGLFESDRRTWTWAGWVKKSGTADQVLYYADNGSTSFISRIQLSSEGDLAFFELTDGSITINCKTNHLLRDYSAWYHLVVALDTTQAVDTERVKMYINGKLQTLGTATYPTQNLETRINSLAPHTLGRQDANTTKYLNGYLSDVYFIDGLQLTPAAFGEFGSSGSGVWNPKAFALPTPNAGATHSGGWSGTFTSGNEATKSFDGLLTTGSKPSNTNTITWTGDIAVKQGVRIYFECDDHSSAKYADIFVNGIAITPTAYNAHWDTADVVNWGTTNLTEIKTTQANNKATTIKAIEVDGVVLIDGKTDISESVNSGTCAFNFPLNTVPIADSIPHNKWGNASGITAVESAGTNSFGLGNVAIIDAAADQIPVAPTGNIYGDPWTIDTYMKLDSLPSAVSYWTGFDADNGNAVFCIGMSSANKFTFWQTSGSDNVTDDTARVVDTWYHIRVTRSAAGKINFWINGTINSGGEKSAATVGSSAGSFTIGNWYGGANSSLSGFRGNIGPTRLVRVDLGAPPAGGLVTTSGILPSFPGGVNTNSYNFKFNETSLNRYLGRDTLNGAVNKTGAAPSGEGAYPFYDTTDDYGDAKDSGTRTDSNSGDLVFAMPGTTLTDVSTSPHTMTNSGVTVSSEQSRFYGTSLYFSGDYLSAPYHADFLNGYNGNFTIEAWVKTTASSKCIMAVWDGGNSKKSWNMYITTNGPVLLISTDGSAQPSYAQSSVKCNTGNWCHVAFVRYNNTIKCYLDGRETGSTAFSGTIYDTTNSIFAIGATNGTAEHFDGYIQDARIYKTAKYTGQFKVPNRNDYSVNNIAQASGVRTVAAADAATKPFYQTTGDQGETKVSPTAYNTDSSAGSTDGTGLVFALPGDVLTDEHDHVNAGSSAKTVGTAGSIATSTSDSRFYGTSIDFGAYNAAKNVHVTAANAGSDFNFGTGDFTVEVWFKQTDQTLNSGSPQTIFDFDANATNSYGGGWLWLATNADNLVLYYSANANSLAYTTVMAKGELLNKWTHFACSHDTSANKLYTFINGELKNEISYSTDWTGDRGVYLGQMNLSSDANRTFAGYMNDFRVYKGVAKYTSAFNPPAIGDVLGNDSLVDTPTNYAPDGGDTGIGGEVRGNYATFNPLKLSDGTITYSQGNLSASGSAVWWGAGGTIAVNKGKWYWEVDPEGENKYIGIQEAGAATGAANPQSRTGTIVYYHAGHKKVDGASEASYGAAYTAANKIGVALDLDSSTQTVTFYKDNTSQGTLNLSESTNLVGKTIIPLFCSYGGTMSVNFGQRAFKYTAPTGFKALCTQNLPDTFDGEAAGTVNNPSKYFDTALWTGNGVDGRDIKGLGFQPDLVWIKARNHAYSHILHDVVRGANKYIVPNSNSAEGTDDNALDAFISDGFTVGNDYWVNQADKTYVAWNWDAGTAASGANTAGTINIASGDQWVNTKAGFSITKYTGNNTASQSIGHGLNAKPEFILIKKTDAGADWHVGHNSIGWTHHLYLGASSQTTAEAIPQDDANVWSDTAPDDTKWYTGANGSVNGNNNVHIAYCWTPIAGYSAFGKYTANNADDGPYVNLGFQPRWILFKNITSVWGWYMHDTAINTFNDAGQHLIANRDNAQGNWDVVDIVSNGFKLVKGASEQWNYQTNEYIYAAFAEHPFKLARAR